MNFTNYNNYHNDLLSAYQDAPVDTLAKVLSKDILNLCSNSRFCKMDLKLIYKVLDHCGGIDPEKATFIYNNLNKYQKMDVNEYLTHIKTRKSHVLKLLSKEEKIEKGSSKKSNASQPSVNNSDLELSENSRLAYLEEKIERLQSQLIDLENKTNAHFNNEKAHVVNSNSNCDIDYSQIVSNLTKSIEKQKRFMEKIQNCINIDVNNRFNSLRKESKYLMDKVQFLSTEVKELRNSCSTIVFNRATRDLGVSESDLESANLYDKHGGPYSYPEDIFACIYNNDIEKTKEFLKKYPDIVNVKNFNGDIPLHIAAARGFIELCELLVNNGSFINERGWDNRTPLRRAFDFKHAQVYKYLMSIGAVYE